MMSLPLRLSKRQSMSSQTVLLRTTLTRRIIIYWLMIWLLGSNHLQQVSYGMLCHGHTFLECSPWKLAVGIVQFAFWLVYFFISLVVQTCHANKDKQGQTWDKSYEQMFGPDLWTCPQEKEVSRSCLLCPLVCPNLNLVKFYRSSRTKH